MNAQLQPRPVSPRLGFLGVGWIGRQRMQVLAASGAAEVAAILDPCEQACAAALSDAPGALCASTFDELLESGIDGLVIATPSAAHASQARAALERGIAVFCQKPLARTAAEAASVVAAAQTSGCLLEVDFSYRHVAGVAAMRELVHGGQLGRVHAVDLAFHNAYGPDKPWFYDIAQSGGGCMMDLGIHLLDLASWVVPQSRVCDVHAQLFAGGERLDPPVGRVEDYASVQARLGDAVLRLACSWKVSAGCDAVIEATFHGSAGGVALRNVDGSFYDFTVDRFEGTRRERIASPPDAWGGRALVAWAQRLAAGDGYDPECEHLVELARTLDSVYGR